MEDEPYIDIEHLIKLLEKIRDEGSGFISFPKAIYLLALEIRNLKLIKEKN